MTDLNNGLVCLHGCLFDGQFLCVSLYDTASLFLSFQSSLFSISTTPSVQFWELLELKHTQLSFVSDNYPFNKQAILVLFYSGRDTPMKCFVWILLDVANCGWKHAPSLVMTNLCFLLPSQKICCQPSWTLPTSPGATCVFHFRSYNHQFSSLLRLLLRGDKMATLCKVEKHSIVGFFILLLRPCMCDRFVVIYNGLQFCCLYVWLSFKQDVIAQQIAMAQ